jgi:hypothetical protein
MGNLFYKLLLPFLVLWECLKYGWKEITGGDES